MQPGAALPQSLFKDSGKQFTIEDYANWQREWQNANPAPPGSNRNMLIDRNNWQGQDLSDRAADMIFQGFGRFEGKAGDQQWRLDYLKGRACRFKGLGLCFSMNLP